MAVSDGTTYSGTISSVRDSYLKLTSLDAYSKSVQWAAFTASPYLKAIGVEGFGVEAMQDAQKFGLAQPTGRIIRYDKGKYGIRGSIFATAPTSAHMARLTAINPQLVEGGDEYAYAWSRLITAEFIPDVDEQDNTDGLIDIKAQKMDGMKQAHVRDVNLGLLGSSSAPDTGVLGPEVLLQDLPNLISVTATLTVGGITAVSANYWDNQRKAVATIGGGGEMDRPIVLRRSMVDALNDAQKNAEASNDFLGVATQGAVQYLDRLMYADTVQARNGGVFGTANRYDACGIDNYAFRKNPIIWDPNVQVPTGATASTEAIYFIHIPSFFVGLRTEENFKWDPWENPRVHDNQRTLVSQIRTRYCQGVTARRPHVVLYNMPACPD